MSMQHFYHIIWQPSIDPWRIKLFRNDNSNNKNYYNNIKNNNNNINNNYDNNETNIDTQNHRKKCFWRHFHWALKSIFILISLSVTHEQTSKKLKKHTSVEQCEYFMLVLNNECCFMSVLWFFPLRKRKCLNVYHTLRHFPFVASKVWVCVYVWVSAYSFFVVFCCCLFFVV